jgi:hypothetical protein
MRRRLAIVALFLGGLTGCGKAPEPAPVPKPQAQPPVTVTTPAPKPPPSTMQTVVDGFTGKAVVERGKATAEKARVAREKEKADLDEVMP